MPTRPGPSVQRRRLGIELRRLREQAGTTIDEVAHALECSNSKVSRIETGQVAATPRDVRDMLEPTMRLHAASPSGLSGSVPGMADLPDASWRRSSFCANSTV